MSDAIKKIFPRLLGLGFDLSLDSDFTLPLQVINMETNNTKGDLLFYFYAALSSFLKGEHNISWHDNFELCDELMAFGINPIDLDYVCMRYCKTFFTDPVTICPLQNGMLKRNENPGAHRMGLYAKKMDSFAKSAFEIKSYVGFIYENELCDSRSMLAYLILNCASYTPLYAPRMKTLREMIDSLVCESYKLSTESIMSSCTHHLNFSHWHNNLKTMKTSDKEMVHKHLVSVLSLAPKMLNGRSLGKEIKSYCTGGVTETLVLLEPDDINYLEIINDLVETPYISIAFCIMAGSLNKPLDFVTDLKEHKEELAFLISELIPFHIFKDMDEDRLSKFISLSYSLDNSLLKFGLPGFFGSEAASSVLINDRLAQYFYDRGYLLSGDDGSVDIFTSDKKEISEYLLAVDIASALGKKTYLHNCIDQALKSKTNDVNLASYSNPIVLLKILEKGVVNLSEMNLSNNRIEKLVRLGASMKMLKNCGLNTPGSKRINHKIILNDLGI